MARFAGYATCILVWSSVSLMAQDPPRRGYGPPSIYAVTAVDAVATELSLTEEQKTKLQALRKEVQEATKTPTGEPQKMSLDMREAKRADYLKKLESFRPKLAGILDAGQLERLEQITWQSAGPIALQDPTLAKKLGLTTDQQHQVMVAILTNAEKMQGAGNESKVQKLREAREKEVMAALTEDQKKQLEQLKGKPFDVALVRGR